MNTPLRTTVMFDMEAIAAQATFYAGWRLGVDGDDAFRTLGPWNTWGGRIDATVHQGLGPTLGLSWDRQDDITTFGVHVGVGAHAPTL